VSLFSALHYTLIPSLPHWEGNDGLHRPVHISALDRSSLPHRFLPFEISREQRLEPSNNVPPPS